LIDSEEDERKKKGRLSRVEVGSGFDEVKVVGASVFYCGEGEFNIE
jgi:hypothetical protein